MTQENDLDVLIRARIKGLRLAHGWSLDALAARCFVSPSSLSRIETGHRRIAIDQLVPIARALGSTVDQLVDPIDDDDVVIRPHKDRMPGITTWLLSRPDNPSGLEVTKIRITARRPAGELRVHPGHDWFTVLMGTVALHLGDRVVLVEPGEAAEFSTMIPHAFTAHSGPAELIGIFDRSGRHAHLRTSDDADGG